MNTFVKNNSLLIINVIYDPGPNYANYLRLANWNSSTTGNVTTVGSNGGPSSYGTYDQSGNVNEWNDLNETGTSRGRRGGAFSALEPTVLSASVSNSLAPSTASNNLGFRIASFNNDYNLLDFVPVDYANENSQYGYGSVSYSYYISKYTVTNEQYVEFLNSVAQTDTYSLYVGSMSSSVIGGIVRSGSSGSYVYSVKNNFGNKPVVFVSWWNAARYCNWIHNNKPIGSQDFSTTENGAYILNGSTGSSVPPAKNVDAKYHIPTENEWYKAAYYNPQLKNYWLYATQSNAAPEPVTASNDGDGIIALEYYWDADGTAPLNDGAGSWDAIGGTNWFNGSSYGSWVDNNIAIFGANNGPAGTIDVVDVQARKILFRNPGSGFYTLSGGIITLIDTAIIETDTSSPTTQTDISSTISGTSGLTKTNIGILNLSGTNTYSGPTSILAGSLVFRSTSSAPVTSQFNISAVATLAFNITDTQTINTLIAGDGALTKDSTGTLILTNSLNNYSGGTTISGLGRLQTTQTGCLGSGSLTLQSTRTDTTSTFLMLGSQAINNNINISTTTGRNNLESKNGNVVISGNINITGAINNVVVYLSNSSGNNLTISGNISGTTTGVQSFRGVAGSTGTISGIINVPNTTIIVDTNGTWTINSTGHTYIATWFGSNGKFILGVDNGFCTSARLYWVTASSGVCDLNGYNQTVAGLESTATTLGNITNNSLISNSILTLAGLTTNYTHNSKITNGSSMNISLIMNSSGRTQTLGGNNTYSGGTTINGGTLRAGSITAFGTGTITINSGATLNLNGFTISNTIVNNGGTIIP